MILLISKSYYYKSSAVNLQVSNINSGNPITLLVSQTKIGNRHAQINSKKNNSKKKEETKQTYSIVVVYVT